MSNITTVGQLKELIENLSDDYKIKLKLHRKLSDEELKDSIYPYPYEVTNLILEFDDIGVSDKVLCLGTKINEE